MALDRAIRGVPAPVLGRTVVVSPGSGKVLVRRPGSPRFRVLDDPAQCRWDPCSTPGGATSSS